MSALANDPSHTESRRRTYRLAGLLTVIATVLSLASDVFLFVAPIRIAASLAMAAAIVTLALMHAAGDGRVPRAGLLVWAASYLLLIPVTLIMVTEVFVDGVAADAELRIPLAWQLATYFWVATVVIGPLTGGVGVVGAGVLQGWRRWTPLAYGAVYALGVVPPVFGFFALFPILNLTSVVLGLVLGLALLTAHPHVERSSGLTTGPAPA